MESVLKASDDFKHILFKIKDDRIASELLNLIDEDINTSYNGLDLTDKHDTISFLSDNQFQRRISLGQSLKYILSTNRDKTGVGRIALRILNDNGIKSTPVEIENFVNKFKVAWTSINLQGEGIRVIKGEEIKYWYFERNYCMDTIFGVGSLGKSCMRYKHCQDYFKIYIDNPEVCSMIIYTEIESGEEVLRARALVWKTNQGLYLDRIYFTDDSEQKLLMDWADENLGCKLSWSKDASKKFVVQLKEPNQKYEEFPYIDSIPYYTVDENKLTNYDPSVGDEINLYFCQDADGGYKDFSVVYSDYLGVNISKINTVWSDYYGSYLPAKTSKWSDYLGSYLFQSDAKEVIVDERGIKDWYPNDSDEFVELKGYYYLKNLVIQSDNEYLLKKDCIYLYGVEDVMNYKRTFDIHIDKKGPFYLSEAASKFFDIKCSQEKVLNSKTKYFEATYRYIPYEDFRNHIIEDSKIDGKNVSDILKEIEMANDYLKEYDLFYKYNNIVAQYGGMKNCLTYLNRILERNNYFTDSFEFYRERWVGEILHRRVEAPTFGNFLMKSSIGKLKDEILRIIEEELFDFYRCFKSTISGEINMDSPYTKKYAQRFISLGLSDETEVYRALKFSFHVISRTLSHIRVLAPIGQNINARDIVAAIIYFLSDQNNLLD